MSTDGPRFKFLMQTAQDDTQALIKAIEGEEIPGQADTELFSRHRALKDASLALATTMVRTSGLLHDYLEERDRQTPAPMSFAEAEKRLRRAHGDLIAITEWMDTSLAPTTTESGINYGRARANLNGASEFIRRLRMSMEQLAKRLKK